MLLNQLAFRIRENENVVKIIHLVFGSKSCIIKSKLLLIVLIVFETSVRLHDWQTQAESSAFYVWLSPLLTTHIIIAITAVLAWVTTLSLALRRFPKPPAPAAHSRTHKRLALLATVLTYLTASSGLLFYLLAFVF